MTRRGRGTPVLAFLAVLALALGGWVLLGRDAAPPAPASADGPPPAAPASTTPADRASRQTERVAAAPQLGALAPTTARPTPSPTATATTPVPGRRSAPGSTAPTTRSAAPAPPPASTTAPASPAYPAEVTRLTNLERAKAGCGPVREDARLAAAALAHSKDMVDRDYFDHISPDGEDPGDRATAAGYPNWSGENIAAGYPTPAAVVQGWMNSPGHKANILNCQSKATGVGFDGRKNMWTQMFGFV